MKTLEELIEEGRRLYYEGSVSLREATSKLLHEAVDSEAEETIRYQGIHELLRYSIKDDRRPAHSDRTTHRPVTAYTPQNGEGQSLSLAKVYPRLGGIWYANADGKPTPLIEFTFDDWKHRAETERAVIQGAENRVRLAAAAAEALQAEGKKKTSQLRKKTLENLELLAREVYGTAGTEPESEHRVGGSVVSGEAQ